eukprot:gb/GEZN01011940.1/.p1 GENE.gb/GEZN01011940.1/~~gb/GEZN01011940.1/.p1  ORF type:complete len:261 (-),score=21.88 gb/GEZN01011940.1/:221-1003(-)
MAFAVGLSVVEALPEGRNLTPPANILSFKDGEEWRSQSNAAVILKLNRDCRIVSIVLKNHGTGFIRMLVGPSNAHEPQKVDFTDWRVLVPWTQLMKQGAKEFKKPQTFRNFSKYVYQDSPNYDCLVLECLRFKEGPAQVGLAWIRVFGKDYQAALAPVRHQCPPISWPLHPDSFLLDISQDRKAQGSPKSSVQPPAASKPSQVRSPSTLPSDSAAAICPEHSQTPCARRVHRKPGPKKGTIFWACTQPGCNFTEDTKPDI